MGGAVSSGRDNAELIDNLVGGNYIRSRDVERVFRALDRGDYMTPDSRDNAYSDLAWRQGALHMSAPCIYSEVMEGLELKPGLSFLNVGSGTGYLSTLVGLILGSGGINHGIEVHPTVVEYATKKLTEFMEISHTLDEFEFCEPKFICGNGLCLGPLQAPYDRVYCGAACPEEYQNYFQQLIKVGGILIMPLNDNLLQVKRTGPTEWASRSLLNVSFATLRVPTKEESAEVIRLEEQTPARLQQLSRAVIRASVRACVRRCHPAVCEPPPGAPPAKRACPRRIRIPIDDDSDSDLNELHDLDRANGANEMNALLSLVLTMGRNRAAGALNVDPRDSDTSGSDNPENEDVDDVDDDSRNSTGSVNESADSEPENPLDVGRPRTIGNVLMFEFRDRSGVSRRAMRRTNRIRPDGEVVIEEDDIRDAREEVWRQFLRRRADDDEHIDEPSEESEENAGERNNEAQLENDNDRGGVTTNSTAEEKEDKVTDAVKEKGNVLSTKTKANGRLSKDKVREDELISKQSTSQEKSNGNEELQKESNSVDELQDKSNDESNDESQKQSSSFFETPESDSRSMRSSNRRVSRDRSPRCKKSRRRSNRSSRKASKDNKDVKVTNSTAPNEAEVEGGETEGPSAMEWESSEPEVEGKEPSSGDEVADTDEVVKCLEEKRQKLDSGIGEDVSPQGGSVSPRSSTRSDDTDEGCEELVIGGRRRQKRGHRSTRSPPARRSPLREDRDRARRAQLARLMAQGIRELPLPPALQLYVNLGRRVHM